MSSGLESNGLYPLPYLISNWSLPTVLHHRTRVRQRLIKLQFILLVTNLIIHSLNNLYFKSVSINFSTNVANTFLFYHTVDLNEIHADSIHYHVFPFIIVYNLYFESCLEIVAVVHPIIQHAVMTNNFHFLIYIFYFTG
jgi:hypothetical protein